MLSTEWKAKGEMTLLIEGKQKGDDSESTEGDAD